MVTHRDPQPPSRKLRGPAPPTATLQELWWQWQHWAWLWLRLPMVSCRTRAKGSSRAETQPAQPQPHPSPPQRVGPEPQVGPEISLLCIDVLKGLEPSWSCALNHGVTELMSASAYPLLQVREDCCAFFT